MMTHEFQISACLAVAGTATQDTVIPSEAMRSIAQSRNLLTIVIARPARPKQSLS